MGKTITPRLRCPCCGRLGWLSQFQKDYPIQIIAVVWHGGRANKNFAQPMPVYDIQRLAETRRFLAERCYLLGRKLGYAGGFISEPRFDIEFEPDISEPTSVELPMVVEYD